MDAVDVAPDAVAAEVAAPEEAEIHLRRVPPTAVAPLCISRRILYLCRNATSTIAVRALPPATTLGSTSLGFPCCSRELENAMKSAYEGIKQCHGGQWCNFNMQEITNKIQVPTKPIISSTVFQKRAEQCFGTPFEVVTGISDYASKVHFFKSYMCKICQEGRYADNEYFGPIRRCSFRIKWLIERASHLQEIPL